jgi:hypothetical protein
VASVRHDDDKKLAAAQYGSHDFQYQCWEIVGIVAGTSIVATTAPTKAERDMPLERPNESSIPKCYRTHVVVTTDNGERVAVQLPQGVHVQHGDRVRAMVTNTRIGYVTGNIASTMTLVA